jgi:hypothetical protein
VSLLRSLVSLVADGPAEALSAELTRMHHRAQAAEAERDALRLTLDRELVDRNALLAEIDNLHDAADAERRECSAALERVAELEVDLSASARYHARVCSRIEAHRDDLLAVMRRVLALHDDKQHAWPAEQAAWQRAKELCE